MALSMGKKKRNFKIYAKFRLTVDVLYALNHTYYSVLVKFSLGEIPVFPRCVLCQHKSFCDQMFVYI